MKNAVNSWNPLLELEEFQKRILGAFYPPTAAGNGNERHQQSLAGTKWAPLVDILEDEGSYVVTAELPQVKREDVKVTVENGMLNVTGERRLVKEEGDKRKYHRTERAYGCFARSFALPEDSDTSKVEAKFEEGLLHIRIGKSENARPKQIEVNVN